MLAVPNPSRLRMTIKEHGAAGPFGFDARVGTSVGTIEPKGLGKDWQMGSTYPYRDYLRSPEDDDEEEEEESFVYDFGKDTDNIRKFLKKTGQSYMAHDPAIGYKRVDTQSTTTGQRLDIATLSEEAIPPLTKKDSVYGTMVPIPFRKLYKKFSGPAVGGSTMSFAYRTGPPRLTGTQYGTSRAPMTQDDGIRLYDIEDIFNTDKRSLNRARASVDKSRR